MFSAKSERPYFEAWLRRTRKQFAASGRLTQIATVLASEDGSPVDGWRVRLRGLLDGEGSPTLELLTRIDALLAVSSSAAAAGGEQGTLFDA